MIVEACENPYVLNIILFIENLFKVFYYVLPGGLVVILIIDLFKALIKGEDNGTKEVNLSIKRLINLVFMFLVPTFIGVVMQFVNDLELFNGDYAACLRNTSNVKEYSLRYDALAKEEEEKRETNRQYLYTKEEWEAYLESKRPHYSSVPNEKAISSFVGQTFDLTDDEIKFLASVCIGEQGSSKSGVSGEASLIANVYEKECGNCNKTLVNWVKTGGWFSSDTIGGQELGSVTNEHKEIVRDILVNGNRTLPLYIDEHDCWNCVVHDKKEKKYCNNGNKGDICFIEFNGVKYSDMSQITKRDNYERDKTKIYSYYTEDDHGDDAYYTFYTFLNDHSDPFGYTKAYYNKITKGNT